MNERVKEYTLLRMSFEYEKQVLFGKSQFKLRRSSDDIENEMFDNNVTNKNKSGFFISNQ